MQTYSPAWPHSEIREIFPDIFFVTGTNITHYNGIELQHSVNMTIVRDGNKLSLINTVRLNDKGIDTLDAIGKVENVIRIGAFHGRHDAFYLDRYKAKFWALKGMKHDNNKITEIELVPNGRMPFPACALFMFETSIYPEGILHIAREGGILISCDSIKNWIAPDNFFSLETAILHKKQGFFGTATISNVWREACKVNASDFARLKSLEFLHLISAHGEPLFNNANEEVAKTIQREFGV